MKLKEVPQAVPASDDVLTSLVWAVRSDSKQAQDTVKANVARSREDVNACMMGGWTS